MEATKTERIAARYRARRQRLEEWYASIPEWRPTRAPTVTLTRWDRIWIPCAVAFVMAWPIWVMGLLLLALS